MKGDWLNQLRKALEIDPGSFSFEDNAYTDETFFQESVQNNFAGWYQEGAPEVQVEFILQYCKVPHGGMVLDIACGHGRHADFFAQKGYDVVGVDISPSLVAHLNLTYGRTNLVFVQRGFIDIDYIELFDLVIILGNSLSLIPGRQVPGVLEKLCASLKRGGKLFLELDNRDYYVKHEAGRRNWNFHAGRWLQFSEHFYDPVEQLEKTVDNSLDLQSMIFKQFRLTKRLYDQQELRALITSSGLTVKRMMGSWEGGDVNCDNPSLLTVVE